MRVLAIGDIHGSSRAFDALLEAIDLGYGDTLVTLGDYVDKGPDSRGVLERLIALDERDDMALVPLLGNHDQMMLEVRKGGSFGWLEAYGRRTLASYGTELALEQVPTRHWDFLERCVDTYETQNHIFVHASVSPDLEPHEAPVYVLRWTKLREEESIPHASGKTLICGHTAQSSGLPLDLDHVVCVDTKAWAGGWLTCLDVHSYGFWQANQDGEVRRGRLRP